MVSIAVSLDEETIGKIKLFPWVNWSEVGREELLKKEIFDEFIRTNKVSESDMEFCNKIDWHPVDELELRQEFVEELKKISKKPSAGKAMSPEELKKWFDEL